MDNKIPHILIVDDDANLLATMSDILKLKGFDPVIAQTGTLALAQLEEHSFDLALIDLRLDDMSGMKVLSAIKARSPETECILLTGHASQNSAIEAIQMGVYGYFQKPFDMEQVLLSIQRAVERGITEKALKESERFAHATVDALASHLAILDETGSIIAVNRAWREFAKANTLGDPNCKVCEGVNYLTVCDTSKGVDSEEASAIAAGIRVVMSGRQNEFTLEYPCHSPDEKRWFIARVTRFPGEGPLRIVVAHENITERKQAEEAVLESEERFRVIFEKANDAIHIENADDKILAVNSRMCELMGYSREELLNMYLADLRAPEIRQSRNVIKTELDQHGTNIFEALNLHCNGRHIPVEISIGTIELPGGELYISIVRDITERKQAEEALQNSEKRFRALIENGRDNISLLAVDGTLLWESPSAVSTLGYAPNQFVGHSIFELMHPDDQVQIQDQYTQLAQTPGRKQDGIFRLQHGDGGWRWIECTAANMLNEPSVQAMVLNYRDITERKQIEDELRRSEQRFQQLANNIQETFWITEAGSGKEIYISPSAEKVWGIPVEDLYQGRSVFLDSILSEDRQIAVDAIERQSNGEKTEMEYRIQHLDGSVHWIWDRAFPVLDETGKVLLVTGIAADITERKQAQEAQKESELQFRALFELSPDAVMLIDPYDPDISWPIVDCNSAACQMNGYRRDELIGHSIDIVNVDPATLSNRSAYIKQIRELGNVQLETFHRHKNGTVFPIEVSTALIKIGDRELMIGIDRDITQRKQAESEIKEQTEDLELINTLNEAVNRGDGLDKVIEVFANELRKINVCKDATIYLISPDEKSFVMSHLGLPLPMLKKIEQLIGRPLPQIQIPIKEGGYFHQALQSEQGLIITDPKILQQWMGEFTETKFLPAALRGATRKLIPQIFRLLDIRSTLILSLVSDKKVIGLLDVSSAEILTEKDLHRIRKISAQLTTVILHKQAEEALLESEDRYRSIFDGVQDAIFIESKDGRILEANHRACEMYGYNRDEFIQKTVVDLVPEGNNFFFVPTTQLNISPIPFETINRRANGDLFPVEVSGGLQTINGKEILLVIVRDITERKKAGDALRESEQKYRVLFDEMLSGVAVHEIICDAQGKPVDYRFLAINEAFEKLTGLTSAAVVGETVLNVMPGIESFWIERYGQVALTREPAQFENYASELGKYFEVRAFSTEKGKFATIFNDITDRKRAEEALRESEALYRQAIEVAGAVPYRQTYNSNGSALHYDFIGEEIRQITGYGADEFTAVLWDSLIQESVLLGDLTNYSMEEAIRRVRTGETSLWKCEHRIRTRDGKIRWIFEAAVELYAENGVAKGSIGMFQDITERKQAEVDIRQRIKELELLYESGLVFSQLLNPREIARKIIELLGKKLDWHHTAIRMVRAQDELELVAFDQPGLENEIEAQTVEAHLRKSITRLDEGLSGWALQQSKIMRIGDVNSEPHYVKSYPGIQSGLYVPLKSGKKYVGVISIESEQPDAFSEADEQLLATLANQVANAFENAHLFQTARQEVIERKRVEKLLADEKNQLAQRVDERTADLSSVNADLAHAVRVKDEFLASMSHELRTPLTGILGLSEVLQLKIYGELNDKQSKALKNIEESGRHLLELINDILDLSKIEAGKLELQFAAYSLTDICQASLQLIKGMAQHKHQHVNYSPPTEKIIVRADARRLKQVLVNLLSNAIKFTPQNGELGLNVEANQSERKIKLTVWDKGIGIKPEDIDKLFKPFTQLDTGLAREYSGTGLGLSLVQHLIEMHNGGIEVESNIGQGSRFTVILPWSPQNTIPIPYIMQRGNTGELNSLSLPAHSKSPLVMYVDDNEMVLQMVSDYLESKQYRVMKVRSGTELLERAAESHPNIILVDIQMPGIGGMETIRRIRAHPDPVVAAAPVIAVTALAMPVDRERCLRAGANDYMSKPLKLKELAATIHKLLERKQ